MSAIRYKSPQIEQFVRATHKVMLERASRSIGSVEEIVDLYRAEPGPIFRKTVEFPNEEGSTAAVDGGYYSDVKIRFSRANHGTGLENVKSVDIEDSESGECHFHHSPDGKEVFEILGMRVTRDPLTKGLFIESFPERFALPR